MGRVKCNAPICINRLSEDLTFKSEMSFGLKYALEVAAFKNMIEFARALKAELTGHVGPQISTTSPAFGAFDSSPYLVLISSANLVHECPSP